MCVPSGDVPAGGGGGEHGGGVAEGRGLRADPTPPPPLTMVVVTIYQRVYAAVQHCSQVQDVTQEPRHLAIGFSIQYFYIQFII